jgi:hypothetical protein
MLIVLMGLAKISIPRRMRELSTAPPTRPKVIELEQA